MPDDAPLGERPPEDELALGVAQARIAAKLFGVQAEVAVGRYRLIELVGRGGMGVVWAAWDPELERKVAIKLVDPLRTAARDRIVDEARALARLSHPNVVPIYDVGVVDDRVYLVMEWVAGDNLRTHLHQPRGARAIVDVYTQAARGLAAVHAAGLIHRDFKPENAMIGADGRVRVLDFGLARGDGVGGEIAGTPRYMAPEQRAGAAPTAAVDQYALGVALREALEARAGGGELPRWLAAIVSRATAERPEDRFASMDAVIGALGRDPARIRLRWALIGLAVVATAAAFVVGRSVDDDTCAGPPAGGVTADARARIAAHLDALGGFAASDRPAVVQILDDHQRAWGIAHRAACVAHHRNELTTTLYERRLTCLARAQASLAATAEIVEHATADSFPDARVATAALVDPELCARVDQSLIPPPPPGAATGVLAAEAAIERARMFATAARPDAVALAASARAYAEATGYAPLVGRALLVEGRAQMLGVDDTARATLDRAMRAAFAARDEATAVEAFARMAYVAARRGETVDGTTVIEAVAAGLGPDGAFARLLLLNNLAVTRLLADRAGARALLETAMAAWRPGHGEDDYELVSIPENLALATDDPARSAALLAQAHAEVARVLGPDHPKVLEIQLTQVVFLDLAPARALQDATCARLAALFPQFHDERANCEYEAGWLADQAGDRAAAATHVAAVPYDPAVEPIRAQVATALIALARPDAAPGAIATSLERAAASPAGDAWERIAAADALVVAAEAWQAAADRAAAHRCWEAARALLAPIDQPFAARRRARVLEHLADP